MLKPPPQVKTKEEFKRCMVEKIDVSVVAAKGAQTDPLKTGKVTDFDEATLTVYVDGTPFAFMDNLFYETEPGI